jgi:hypothetical protein
MNETVGIDIDPTKIIPQNVVSSRRACVPACFLNALKFGPSSFQKRFAGLSGDSDKEKLSAVIQIFGSEPSGVRSGARRFEGGVLHGDAAGCFNSVLSSKDHLTTLQLDIEDEETPNEHLRRVHGRFVSSLKRGVPIVASIAAYAARYEKGEFGWNRIAEHAILIVRVPTELAANVGGFVFRFVEPSKAELCEGYIYSETVREFRAIKGLSPGYTYDETAKRFVVMKGTSDQWIDGGFLHVVSPSLLLRTYNEPWYVRTFFALTHATGKFSLPQPLDDP